MNLQLEENMDILLAKYIDNQCTKEEIMLVEKWRQSSGKNENYFNEILKISKISEKELNEFNPDIEKALKKISPKLETKKSNTKLIYFISGIAASIIIIFSTFFIFNNNSNKEEKFSAYKNHSDSIVEIILSDKSIISLKSGSELKYLKNFASNKRIVKLKGEAFFEIAKDKNRPFYVKTEKAQISVLGTSFNVLATNKLEVIVVSGKVKLNTNTDSVILQKNTKAIVENNSFKIDTMQVIGNKNIDFKQGIINFEGEKLENCVKILKEFYKVEIIIQQDLLSDLQIFAKFKNNNIDEVLEIICITLNINMKKENNIYYLYQ